MNLLVCATHVVADAAAAAARAAAHLQYVTVETGVVDAALAASWGTSASAGRGYSLCRPASCADGFLRFVEGDPVAAYRPIRSYGWAAIELCVADVQAAAARMMDTPYTIIGPPSAIPGLTTIHPMQVRGPDAEVLYLTQILTDAPRSGLPRNVVGIDRPFILVLACADLTANARWFGEVLGLRIDAPLTIRYRMIAQAFGLPAERLHTIVTASHGGDICLELDQYPNAATARTTHPGALPPGVAIGTFAHPDFAGIKGDWITPPAPRDGALYRGRRAATLRTPEGALVELIEA